MARKGAGLRARCVAACAVALALAVAPVAGRTLPSAAVVAGPRDAGRVLAATAAADADAAAHRKLLLFGLTARDKAAHEEKRDALIEVRRAPARAPYPAGCSAPGGRTRRAGACTAALRCGAAPVARCVSGAASPLAPRP
jgi:hypothetical protein